MPRATDSILANPVGRLPLSKHSKPRALTEVRKLLEDDIGREVVIEALDMRIEEEEAAKSPDSGPINPLDPIIPSKFRVFRDRLSDSAIGGHQSITVTMQQSGITVWDIIKLVQKRTIALAMARSAARMDEVLEAVEEASVLQAVTCPKCHGEGDVEAVLNPGETDPEDISSLSDIGEEPTIMTERCTTCDGAGTLRKLGDIEAQKLYLRLHGLDQKGGGGAGGAGTTINVQAGARIDNTKSAAPVETALTRVERIINSSSE